MIREDARVTEPILDGDGALINLSAAGAGLSTLDLATGPHPGAGGVQASRVRAGSLLTMVDVIG